MKDSMRYSGLFVVVSQLEKGMPWDVWLGIEVRERGGKCAED
jgi:hypothetical protein